MTDYYNLVPSFARQLQLLKQLYEQEEAKMQMHNPPKILKTKGQDQIFVIWKTDQNPLSRSVKDKENKNG